MVSYTLVGPCYEEWSQVFIPFLPQLNFCIFSKHKIQLSRGLLNPIFTRCDKKFLWCKVLDFVVFSQCLSEDNWAGGEAQGMTHTHSVRHLMCFNPTDTTSSDSDSHGLHMEKTASILWPLLNTPNVYSFYFPHLCVIILVSCHLWLQH